MARILSNGIHQGDLVDLLASIRLKFATLLAKLDADSTVGSTDYVATYAVAMASGIQTSRPKCIRDQGQVVTFLNNIITQFNLMLTHLDADAGVSGTNFHSLWVITDAIGNPKIDGIVNDGIYQENLIKQLNNIIAAFAGVNAKLDLDGGVADTNYASLCNVTDNVIEAGSRLRPRISGWIVAFLLSSLLAGGIAQARGTVEGDIFNSSASLPTVNTNAVDVGNLDRFSLQAVYRDGTPAAVNFTDGRKSTDTLTIVDYTSAAILNKSIVVDGQTFTFGVEIATSSTAVGVATNTTAALNANTTLHAEINFTTGVVSGKSVIFASATAVGAGAFDVYSSTPFALAWSGVHFENGLASDVAIAGDTITVSGHGYPTGLKVVLSTTVAVAVPTGLAYGGTYYVIVVDADHFKLASSTTNAVAGTAVDITALTGGGGLRLTPSSISAGSAALKWQGSNDGSNWTDLNTTTYPTVSYSAAGSTLWDFGAAFNSRFIRAVLTGPTAGAVFWQLRLRGKLDLQ